VPWPDSGWVAEKKSASLPLGRRPIRHGRQGRFSLGITGSAIPVTFLLRQIDHFCQNLFFVQRPGRKEKEAELRICHGFLTNVKETMADDAYS
jgi:hypothetical protein